MNCENIEIINDDILTTEKIEENSIDLIVTSPPYNVDISYNSVDDNLEYSDYLEFTRQWMKRCYTWLKPDGRFCINIPLTTNKGGIRPIGSDVTQVGLDLGFGYKTTIIWDKVYNMDSYCFGSWMSASSPSVYTGDEIIVVFFKEQWKKLNKGISTLTKEDFVNNMRGKWKIIPESRKKIGHPAPFPIDLPRRAIKMFSYQDDLILDPFCGSGTTCIAAYQEKRRAIGVELDPNYYDLAVRRFNNETRQRDFLDLLL